MSRIGQQPITIEQGVEVNINNKNVVVKGPKGEIEITLPFNISAEIKDNEVIVKRKDETKQSKSSHGTFRMLLANAITGVKSGFEKKLELVGVGYRARLEGTKLVMSLGWNHPVEMEAPEGISFEVPDETKIVVKGSDKQKVGECTAKIRSIRKPEPYKGKGIRYAGEYIRRKSSKSAAA